MPIVELEELQTPSVAGPEAEGLIFDEAGTGITLGPEEVPLRFPTVPPDDVEALFPTYIPNAEQIVWDALNDATQTCIVFPDDPESGPLLLPLTFETPPGIGLFADTDPVTYPTFRGRKNSPIVIVKGWPAYPGEIPQIGVAIATENEDGSQQLGQGGFAGDAYARDENGNILATTAYYAEPLYSVIVVELIHENRDERDRLHNQIRRVLYPLRHIVPSSSPLVKELKVQNEKQDLPVDEQPLTLYVSVFTVEVWSEALIPTEVQVNPAVVGPFISDVQVEGPG